MLSWIPLLLMTAQAFTAPAAGAVDGMLITLEGVSTIDSVVDFVRALV